MYRIACTQHLAFKGMQTLLLVYSVQGKKYSLIMTQRLVCTVYSTTLSQCTVFKICRQCYWCTVYRGKKIEPNLYSQPGVHIVQDCLYTAFSIQRFANVANGVQCTRKKRIA